MNQKQRRGKPATSNINININLKVDTKHNQPTGKKIMQQKEVQKLHEPIRPNHTIDTMTKKKLSCQESHKYKYTLQDLGEEKTQNWCNLDQRYNQYALNRLDKQNLIVKNSKSNLRKRLKSKSLQNLKVKYYARTPESVSKSHSKINSRSKSKSKSKSKKCKENQVPSPKSFLHSQKKKSASKSKSKSKSPLISKKRSLQTFKTREDTSNREAQKDKSKDMKRQKNKDKVPSTLKKNQNQPSQKNLKTNTNIQKKLSEPTKSKFTKSKEKVKQYSPEKHPKQSISTIHKSKGKKVKKAKKDTHIYSQTYLDKMATKIQSVWRGYMVRRRLKEQLNEINNKIKTVRNQINFKGSNFWQTQSNHSIIQLQSESNKTAKSESVKNNSQRSAVNDSSSINPQFMIQIEKLRKKLEEQQDRFKQLQLQNNELKANLSKIGSEVKPQPKKELKKVEKELEMNRVVCLRIQSQQSEKDAAQERKQQKKKEVCSKRRDMILGLPAVIKTQQSRQQQQYAEMKKKMQYYECSPKNESGFNVKFNKNILKKLFIKQEEKLNQKYFKKSKEYTEMLKNQLVSPKSYQLKCFELETRFSKEKAQYVNKYQQAQKALLLIDQLQQEEQESSILEKENENKPNNHSQENTDLNKRFIHSNERQTKTESPYKKTINLFINVDQIQTNAEKYPPIISSNSHREHQLEVTNEQDLSQLYQKVMDQRQINNKRDEYIQRQEQIQNNNSEKSPEYHKQQTKNSQSIASKASDYNQFKGFQTNLKYIRSFYIKFCEYFRQIDALREQVEQNISNQLLFNKETYLKSYRTYEQDSNSNEAMFPYFKLLAPYNTGIPIQILNNYYQQLTDKDSQLYHSMTTRLKENSKEESRQLGYSIYELKQYHDLALMDAFNESINFERPGGPHGSNLDDLTHDYHAINKNRIITKLSPNLKSQERQQNLNIILGNTIGRVINEWACGLCGFINDAPEEGEQLDQSKIQEVRLQRLTLMLQKALLEEQSSMTNTYPFRLAVKLQAQKDIFSLLVSEMIADLQKIKQKQINL